MKAVRDDEDYRKKEREKQKEQKKAVRDDEDYRKKEREKQKEQKKAVRDDMDYHQTEREKEKKRMKAVRDDEDFRKKEREKQKEQKKAVRDDEDYRKIERERERERMKLVRENEEYREKENERNRKRISESTREDEESTKIERERKRKKMQIRRIDFNYREQELASDRRQKKAKRQSDIMKYKENYINLLRRRNDDSSMAQLNFLCTLKDGPVNVCCCCEGLFFSHSVVKFDEEKMKQVLARKISEVEPFLEKITNFVATDFICRTCKSKVIKGEIPKMATSWGMKFPIIPDCVKQLNSLEERMVAPILNFMQIRPLKRYALNPQIGMKGSIVNIMIDIDEMLQVLPRSFDTMATVQVKLKRHVDHKSDYMFERIRPAKICEALNFLVNTPLYKKYNIIASTGYIEEHLDRYEEEIDFVVDNNDKTEERDEERSSDLVERGNDESIEVIESEDDEYMADNEQVLIMDRNREMTIEESSTKIIAPGQGLQPIPWHRFPDLDELCFPSIFAGQPTNTHPKLSYSDRAKSEARRADRRSCVPERLLFMAKSKMERTCLTNINICLRKSNKNIATMKAKDVLDGKFIEKAVQSDDCYRVLRQTRSSPAYWECKKKEILAMIRQLGTPTFFLTLSAAELSWTELMKTLLQLSRNKNATDLEIAAMSDYDKTQLVRNDPVTCARYFNNKVKKFMSLLRSKNGPFSEHWVVDSYERVEFQQRGSPHEHIFLWCNNAPKYIEDDQESVQSCVDFINRHITCMYDENNPLISMQRHKHTDTCYKGKRSKKICRFGYPIPAMPRTMILKPLKDEDKTVRDKENNSKVSKLMYRFFMKNEDMSFDEILSTLNMNEEEYIRAVRYGIDRSKVFLQRQSNAVSINAYNLTVLSLFQSNMDLQFVLDPYSCASYIINYISKVEAGLSKLLKEAAKEVNAKGMNTRERLRQVTNVFLNSNLMCAQEAAYHVLGLPLSNASRGCVFINTCPINERVFMLKSNNQLQALDPESNDIGTESIFQKYAKRSKNMERKCLADYATEYRKKAKETDGSDIEDDEEDGTEVVRRKQKVLRYRRYRLHQDEYNFYREQVLLFTPWRDEEKDIESNDSKALYLQHADLIDKHRKKYNMMNPEEIEEALEFIAIHMEAQENKDYEELIADELGEGYKVDINVQGGICAPPSDNKKGIMKIVTPLKDQREDLLRNLARLNEGQREIVMHIYKTIKEPKSQPLRLFLSGAAGVGKSLVIKVLFQMVTSYYDNVPGAKSDTIKVLLTAPTGKAAFLINGVTIHSAFSLPVSQFGGLLSELSADVANSLRAKLIDLKLLIVDEGSMVGSKTLNRVDTRLRQIMGRNECFGGISVLIVGDLHQLVPVMDSPLWKPSNISDLDIFNGRNPIWEEFSFFELTEIMRQKGDGNFINALNRIAENRMSDADFELLKTQIVQQEDVPEDAIWLYPENAQVSSFNNHRIQSHNEEGFTSIAQDVVLGNVSSNTRQHLLASMKKKKATEMQGLAHEIVFKVGIKYMITYNVDVEDGLVNGACGILRHITAQDGNVLRIWLEFPGTREVGSKCRAMFIDYMRENQLNAHYVPVSKASAVVTLGHSHAHQVLRKQFPVVPAEAITIHKSQGQTYPAVCLDFTNVRRASRQLLYVALSRATSLKGVYLLGEPKRKFFHFGSTSDCVEIERLRSEKNVTLSYNDLRNVSGTVIVFHNVRSLNEHITHIQRDKWYSRAHLVILAETRNKQPITKQKICDLNVVYDSHEDRTTGARGIMCLVKNIEDFSLLKTIIRTENKISDNTYKGHVELIGAKFNGIYIITGYKSPAAAVTTLTSAMDDLFSCFTESIPVVVAGDFNVNLNLESCAPLMKYMHQKNLRSALKDGVSTTDWNTQIDVIFTNTMEHSSEIYESYFSDHKPVFIDLLDNTRMRSDHQEEIN